MERSKSVQHVLFAVARPLPQLALTIALLLVILIVFGFAVFYYNRDKVRSFLIIFFAINTSELV